MSRARITDERVSKAVREFNKMTPGLTALVRSLTGKPEMRVLPTGKTPHTDGKNIYMRPPIQLGDEVAHERFMCDRRDMAGQQRCPACRVREDVIITLYHEIAHNVFDSFQRVTETQRKRIIENAVRRAARERGEHRVAGMKERLDSEAEITFIGLANLVSPFLQMLLNAMEDGRINRRTMEAHPGTKAMYHAQMSRIFVEGIEGLHGGGVQRWKDRSKSSQAIVGLLSHIMGYDPSPYLDPQVAADLHNPDLQRIAESVGNMGDAQSVYEILFETLDVLQSMGYCLTKKDVPPPPPPPVPDHEDTGGDSDDEGEADEDDVSELEEEPDRDIDSEGSTDSGEGSESHDEPSDGHEEDDVELPGLDGDDELDEEEDSDEEDESWGSDSDTSEEDGATGESDDSEEVGVDDEGESGEPDADIEEPGSDSPGDDEEDDLFGDGEDLPSDGVGGEDDDLSEFDDEDYEEDSTYGDDTSSDMEGRDDLDSGLGSGPGGISPDEELDEDGSGGSATGEDVTAPEPFEEEDPDEVGADVDAARGHGEEETEEDSYSEAEVRRLEEELDRAIEQAEHFDSASKEIIAINIHRATEHIVQGSRDITERYMPSLPGSRENLELAPETAMTPALAHMRRVFAENKKGKLERNLKRGKIDGGVLAKRAPFNDPRMMRRKSMPGKRSYHVAIGLDISGSSAGGRIQLMRSAVAAQAELCKRVGVDFSIYAHSGQYARDGYSLDILHIKEPNEPWSNEIKDRLGSINSMMCNLDGHSMEYYRKQLDAIRGVTDKIIMYYTDGGMPAENYYEEKEVLQSELETCQRKDYTVACVAVHNDEPQRYGLETVRIDSMQEVPAVVKHLEKLLTR